jgi:HK97 family phage major capsid protein
MKSASQLSKEIEALQAKVGAIQAIAKEDNRDLLPEEQVEIDSIVGDDKNPGQITALATQRERAIRIESAISNSVRQVRETQAEADLTYKPFRIPARAKSTRPLLAFKGEDAEMDAYRSGKYILATIYKCPRAEQWCKDHGVQAVMSGSDDLRGGTLVPPEFESAVIALFESYGVLARYARNQPMASDTLSVPRQLSDVIAYAVGESDEITASDPTTSPVNLVARKFGTMTRVPSELNDDAVISIAEMVATSIARAQALRADTAGFLGNGEAANHGIQGLANVLNAGSVVTASVGNTMATQTIAVFQEAVGKLPDFPGINPVWFCHKAIWSNVLGRLQLASGGNNKDDLGNGPVVQFLGYPVVFVNVMPKTITGSSKFAHFGDLGMASTLGMRRRLSIAADASRYFELDQIAYRSTMRYDFNCHERGTASEAGPILTVQAAA